MGVDVTDVTDGQLSVGQGIFHTIQRTGSTRIGDMAGIGTQTVTTDLSVNVSTAFLCQIEPF